MPRLSARFAVSTLALSLGAGWCAFRAHAAETWELGDAGWNQVAAPDPNTPAGQLQLLRRELVRVQAGVGPGVSPEERVNAFLKAHPQYVRGSDGKPLSGEALEARRKFWASMLVPAGISPQAAAGLGNPASTADEVVEKVDEWLKAYPRHELEAEARLLHGDALAAQRKFWKALYDYEFIARHFTATPTFVVALDRERRVAETFLAGWKRKFLGLAIVPTREEGVELLVRIQERAPGSEIGEQVSLRLGDWYFETADMDMAVEAYGIFLQNYPGSRSEAVVSRRIIQASLARFSGPQFDSTGLVEARQRLEEFKKKHPADAEKLGADALLVRIGESLALRDFFSANWYERRGEIVSAAVLYRRLALAYPKTQAASDAILRLAAIRQPLVDERDPASVRKPAAESAVAPREGP